MPVSLAMPDLKHAVLPRTRSDNSAHSVDTVSAPHSPAHTDRATSCTCPCCPCKCEAHQRGHTPEYCDKCNPGVTRKDSAMQMLRKNYDALLEAYQTMLEDKNRVCRNVCRARHCKAECCGQEHFFRNLQKAALITTKKNVEKGRWYVLRRVLVEGVRY